MVLTKPSLLRHLRDILILPFTVTCILPFFIYNPAQHDIPNNLLVRTIGLVFLLCGVSLFLYTVILFNNIGKGTLAPWSPTQKLVVVGPYRYCRNPMISGVLFILLGEVFILHSTNVLIEVVFFLLINTLYFIFSEEPGLLRRFGEDYQVYKQNVPRWIPRITPYRELKKM
jgi:protein-S-isoprenylcysteine O-methyltransferase Ste14